MSKWNRRSLNTTIGRNQLINILISPKFSQKFSKNYMNFRNKSMIIKKNNSSQKIRFLYNILGRNYLKRKRLLKKMKYKSKTKNPILRLMERMRRNNHNCLKNSLLKNKQISLIKFQLWSQLNSQYKRQIIIFQRRNLILSLKIIKIKYSKTRSETKKPKN